MKFLFLIIFIYSGLSFAVQPPCNDFFEEVIVEVEAQDTTSELIAYLTRLLEENQIGETELARLMRGEAPITDAEALSHIHLKIFREDIQSYWANSTLNVVELTQWASRALSDRQKIQDRRSVVNDDTYSHFTRPEFHPIPRGKFIYRLSHIRTGFEMMSTPVTQGQWYELMGDNPSEFHQGEEALILKDLGGNKISVLPDHPVDNISLWSAMEFANRLSIRAGLKPAYDFSRARTSGSAEEGNLMIEAGLVYHNSFSGLARHTEGYRIPSRLEWEYVASQLGVSKLLSPYVGGDLISEKVWDYLNARGVPQAVGQLKPFMANGYPFYDLLGNVSEWTMDPNCIGLRSRFLRCNPLAVGGSALEVLVLTDVLQQPEYISWHDIYEARLTGFRLVRTLE